MNPHIPDPGGLGLRRRKDLAGPYGRENSLTYKSSFFCQTEFILDDSWNRESLGAPEMYRIEEKRYNNEIFGAGLGPV